MLSVSIYTVSSTLQLFMYWSGSTHFKCALIFSQCQSTLSLLTCHLSGHFQRAGLYKIYIYFYYCGSHSRFSFGLPPYDI
ncbi:hypothetical protein FKM82_006051 [Ascaphus truei]